MGNRIIIAVSLILGLAAASARAGSTNSWNFAGDDGNNFWDIQTKWSLGAPPSISDAADFITNVVSKPVMIDQSDTSSFKLSLTISNLTVAGTGNTVNTLNLTNMNNGDSTIALTVLNLLTIGSGGQLQIVNSKLHAKNASIATNSVLLFALGTNFTPVAITSNLTLGGTINIANAGGFTTTNYTLFTYGGVLTYNGLTVGTTPSNATCFVDISTNGQVNLVVSSIPPPPQPASFKITSIIRNTSDVVISWTSTVGNTNVVQAVNGGTSGYATNGFQNISASIIVTGITTTNYVDSGGATNSPSRFYRVRQVP